MTRKEYVVSVVEQIKENPRAVLSGHGLPAPILKLIGTRPDVLAKLAVFGYSTKLFSKGAKGLKKANNFKISGYKNFPEFNAKAREDVETFVDGLSPDDASVFENANNILTFIVLPDTATENTEKDIVELKSVAVTFDSSVKKEFRIPGGMYVTIMWGNSVIRTVEEKKAVVKEKINKRVVAKKTPARIKNELTKKAKVKLARIKVEGSKLQANASKTRAELQQFAQIGKTFGVQNYKKPSDVISAMKSYTQATKAFVSSLPALDKKLFKDALAYKKAGKLKLMYSVIGEISAPYQDKCLEIVRLGNVTAEALLAGRTKEIKGQIAKLVERNAQLLAVIENASSSKERGNANFAIRKNNAKIAELKARLGVHKNMAPSAILDKKRMLKETSAAIEANKAKGMSVSQALNAAIAKLPVNATQKQQIKQQTVAQMSAGTPVQYAVQQAIQSVAIPQATSDVLDYQDIIDAGATVDVFGTADEDTAGFASQLANSKTVKDIMSFL